MPKETRIILVILAVGLILFSVATLASYERTKNETSIKEIRHENEKEKSVFRTYYMEACNLNGEMTKYCACTWDHMFDETGGLEGMIDMMTKFEKDEKFTPEMMNAMQACVKHMM